MVNVCLTTLIVDNVVQPMTCDLISLLLHEVCPRFLQNTPKDVTFRVCPFVSKTFQKLWTNFDQISKACSHCRSDQFDRFYLLNFLTKLDQARSLARSSLYTTCFRPLLDHARPPHDLSRLLHDFNPTTNSIFTQLSQSLCDFYSTKSINSTFTRT